LKSGQEKQLCELDRVHLFWGVKNASTPIHCNPSLTREWADSPKDSPIEGILDVCSCKPMTLQIVINLRPKGMRLMLPRQLYRLGSLMLVLAISIPPNARAENDTQKEQPSPQQKPRLIPDRRSSSLSRNQAGHFSKMIFSLSGDTRSTFCLARSWQSSPSF